MGDNRENAVIHLELENNIIEYIGVFFLNKNGKIDSSIVGKSEIAYLFNNDTNTYRFDRNNWEMVEDDGKKFPLPTLKIVSQGLPVEQVTNGITKYILENNDKFSFHIKVGEKEITYEELCQMLGKNEAIVHAQGLKKQDVTASDKNTGNNKNLNTIKKGHVIGD